MASSWSVTKKNSTANIIIPDIEVNRKVSLTGYSNVVIDESTNSSIHGEQNGTNSSTHGDENGILREAKLPVNKVGWFSYIFITWFSALAWKMFWNRKEQVSDKDIWQCTEEDGVGVNTDRLIRLWSDEVNNKGPKKASFQSVWIQFIRTRSFVSLAIISLMALSVFCSYAFLVNLLLIYIESGDANLSYGIALVAAVFASELIRACVSSDYFIFSSQTGIRFRAAFMGLMYDKLLKIKTLKGKTSSEIINIFSVDSYRVLIATQMVPFLLAVPIYLTIGTTFCYTLIGYWCFVPLLVVSVCYCLQTLLVRVLQYLRKRCAKLTDARVRIMSEILTSMKFIKMFAWEEPFREAITDVRKAELTYLLYSAFVSGTLNALYPLVPIIASVATLTVYSAVGNTLSASTAFAVLGTMNFLKSIFGFIPYAAKMYSEATVSFRRIQSLLILTEIESSQTECLDKGNCIEIKAGYFIWDETSSTTNEDKNKSSMSNGIQKNSNDFRQESVSLFQMSDIDFEVKQGTLLGICGSVGAGKSSLMSAIIGRMSKTKGHLAVKDNVAYVAQQAWIFNGSLKENILFGVTFHQQRYRNVIEACGLKKDIRDFVDGDETEIGERGINLSGGQKQRVNLARAVYSDTDIYLLDDPLSAVDVHVGTHIFHSCIQGLLGDKTVLLVTHQLQVIVLEGRQSNTFDDIKVYLKHCDEVVVLDDGTILERGHHEELLNKGGLYSDMLKVFENTTIKTENIVDAKGNNAADYNETSTNSHHTKETKKKGKLIIQEESQIGSVSLSTYMSYVNDAGGVFVALLVVAVFTIAAGSTVFSDWWLSLWINSISLKISKETQRNSSDNNITSTSIKHFSKYFTNVTNLPATHDDTTTQNSFDLSYNTYFLVYIVSLSGIVLLQIGKTFAFAKATNVSVSRLHTNCLDKVMKAPMSFFDTNPVGRILNRFSKDLDEGDVFIPMNAGVVLYMSTFTLVSIAMAVYVTPWILIPLVPVVSIFSLLKMMSSVSIRQLKRIENTTRSPLLSHVNVTSQGLSTIVGYKQQRRFYDKFKEIADVSSVAVYLFSVSTYWVTLRLDFVAGMITVSTALILVLTKGTIPSATAGLLLGLCGRTVNVIQYMILMMNDLEARFTSIERLQEYEKNIVSEPQNSTKSPKENWPPHGAIIFRNVVMRYRPEMDPVLKGVSFEIFPQEKVGIVGRTGAGKSSLVAVLFRLVELSEGQVLVDDEDISQLPLSVIRNRISTISQEPVLFNGTVRYNMDPFNMHSDEDIWAAMEKVHMKKKILEFDEGLHVVIEENGDNLSVGERQLVCLARALLRDSKVVLLDEATANIDTSTDALIQQTIKECFSECTVITIAHRLNTVLHSDKIIVMGSGKVMECASPQELLSNPHSVFNSMIAAQSVTLSA